VRAAEDGVPEVLVVGVTGDDLDVVEDVGAVGAL
jgi:hypothetical protein